MDMIYKAYNIDTGGLAFEADTRAELFATITDDGEMDAMRMDEGAAEYAVYELSDVWSVVDLHHVSNLPDEATLLGHYRAEAWDYEDAA